MRRVGRGGHLDGVETRHPALGAVEFAFGVELEHQCVAAARHRQDDRITRLRRQRFTGRGEGHRPSPAQRAHDLGVAIVSGKYKPGDTLSGEVAFSQQMKVSRSAYREATRWGLDVFWFLGPLWILVGIPLIDTLIGTEKGNPPAWADEALERDRYYRILTYLYLPLQYAGFFWGAWMFTHGDLTLVAKVGLTLTVGAVGGIGIANAHELGHKKDKLERWWGKVVLAQTAYGHFTP